MFAKLLLTSILTGILSFNAAAETVIIINPANSASIDAKEIQRIYLGKEKKFSTGSEVIAINQDANSSVRKEFDEGLLSRSTSQVSAYWSKLVFTGKGSPPKEVSSDAEVVDLVSQNPNVIGYIDSSSVTAAVKVIKL